MKLWPWSTGRGQSSGAATQQAKDDADRQLEQAHDRAERTEEIVRSADELAARSERFIRSVERSMHLRRGSV